MRELYYKWYGIIEKNYDVIKIIKKKGRKIHTVEVSTKLNTIISVDKKEKYFSLKFARICKQEEEDKEIDNEIFEYIPLEAISDITEDITTNNPVLDTMTSVVDKKVWKTKRYENYNSNQIILEITTPEVVKSNNKKNERKNQNKDEDFLNKTNKNIEKKENSVYNRMIEWVHENIDNLIVKSYNLGGYISHQIVNTETAQEMITKNKSVYAVYKVYGKTKQSLLIPYEMLNVIKQKITCKNQKDYTDIFMYNYNDCGVMYPNIIEITSFHHIIIVTVHMLSDESSPDCVMNLYRKLEFNQNFLNNIYENELPSSQPSPQEALKPYIDGKEYIMVVSLKKDSDVIFDIPEISCSIQECERNGDLILDESYVRMCTISKEERHVVVYREEDKSFLFKNIIKLGCNHKSIVKDDDGKETEIKWITKHPLEISAYITIPNKLIESGDIIIIDSNDEE